MRTTLLVGAFAALAIAAPRPQEIEFELVDAAPNAEPVDPDSAPSSVAIQPSAAASTLAVAQITDVATTNSKRDIFVKRDGDCHAEPAGTGPAVHSPDDTDTSFMNYQPFMDASTAAALPANVPDGYSLAFSGLQGSSQIASYLGYTTLTSYDPIQCARYCDQLSSCVAFNLYFERDPSTAPNAINCPNPASVTNIKCVRWGVKVDGITAINSGEHRDDFHVVIQGSNGYNKNAAPAPAPGFSGPMGLGGAINAPLDPVTNTNTYMGYKFFALGPVAPAVQSYANGVSACLSACSAQTAYNSRHPPAAPKKPDVCNQVVVYVLSDENQPQGVYCAMYSEEWAPSYATNVGQWRGSHWWSVSEAYAYTNATYDAKYEPICAVGGCPSGSYRGGNCGGWGGSC